MESLSGLSELIQVPLSTIWIRLCNLDLMTRLQDHSVDQGEVMTLVTTNSRLVLNWQILHDSRWFSWLKIFVLQAQTEECPVLFACSEIADLKLNACTNLRFSFSLVTCLFMDIFCITIKAFDVANNQHLSLCWESVMIPLIDH